jgi:hypothetical protein
MPETAAAYDALDRYARSIGISIAVANYGGLRTEADTNRILQYRVDDYADARSRGAIRPDTTLQQFRPIAPFGKSYHNYGAAFDINIVARPSNVTVAQALAKLGAYAPQIGLRWGGTFHDADTPHFELAVPLATAQSRYRASAPTSILPPLGFDLSSFLPGLTPASDEIEATLDVPDVYGPDNESGEIAFTDLPPEQNTAPLLVLGLFVAGVMAWAIRRKFL